MVKFKIYVWVNRLLSRKCTYKMMKNTTGFMSIPSILINCGTIIILEIVLQSSCNCGYGRTVYDYLGPKSMKYVKIYRDYINLKIIYTVNRIFIFFKL